MTFLAFQPGNLLRRELDVERLEAVIELFERARADQRYAREGLCQHIGKRHMDWALAEVLRQLDCPVATAEVLLVVPAADEFLAVPLVAASTVGEETAALAGPGEVGHLPVDQPLLEVGRRGRDA